MSAPTPPTDNPLGIETSQVNGVQVLRFRNAKILSEQSVRELGDRLMACIDAIPGSPRVAISFDGVNFLSSAGIGKLILLHRKIKERGGELKLCEIHPSTFDIFRVAHLHDYFDIRTDLNSALASFSP